MQFKKIFRRFISLVEVSGSFSIKEEEEENTFLAVPS